MKEKVRSYIKLCFVLLIWSSDFILGKYLNLYLPPIVSIAIRFTLASICLLLLLLAQGMFVLPRHKDLFVLLALGVGVVGLRYPLQYIALQYTDSINGVLINSLTPILTALLASIFLRQHISRGYIGCITLSVVGVACIALAGQSGLPSINLGNGLVLLGTLLWSVYNVAGKSVMTHLSPLQTTFYTCSFSLLLTIPFALYNLEGINWGEIPMGAWLGILYIGVLGSGVGMYWWYASIKEIGAIKAALLYNIMPLFTAVMAVVLLGERLTLVKMLGGTLVLIGSALTAQFTE